MTDARLYEHTAQLFDLRYSQKDYAAEARLFKAALDRVHPDAQTLLDVACGTGGHLQYLGDRYHTEGLDLSPELLDIARTRMPDVVLHEADMATFTLERRFDIVTCFFASIPYLRTVDRLREAVTRMSQHLKPGGVLFLEPWLTPTSYRENEVVHNFRRTPELAASWMYVQRRDGNVATWDIHWLVGTPTSGVRHFVEHEDLALYSTEECLAAFTNAGLDVWHHSHGLHGYGAFWGRKGARWSQEDVAALTEILPA